MEQKCKIPTYVVNLKHRTDRKDHTIQQFSNREEFDLKITPAVKVIGDGQEKNIDILLGGVSWK